MRIIETVAELQAQSRAWQAGGETVGLVPTMGALHDGHLSLVRAAQEAGDRVIVSVFVNPTQFTERADLDAYPRDFDSDAAILEAAGVDAVFHPTVEEMYPAGLTTSRVRPGRVAELFEGEQRPGHFEGVVTVVARLFNAALPVRAYFGRKDAQQLAVISAMARDLGFPLEVIGCPTVREVDGLAMSSRNGRLIPATREPALALVRALAEAQRTYRAGIRDSAPIAAAVTRSLQAVPGVEIEYAAVVDPTTFRVPSQAAAGSLAVIAARVGGVRLIDNAEVGAGDVLRYAVESPLPVTDINTRPTYGVPA
jgi:pantoate--beta-alanine ligase